DRRDVTDSGGHREQRIFIRTLVRLPGGQEWPIELNLTQRRNMAFPMLLGRSALRRRCLVEPARSWLQGVPDAMESPR
ncbi:MAG: RimK/LysX family protein, partial [Arenimonas sp.]